MRETSTFHLDCYACHQAIEIPDGVDHCPKCGAELALEWRQPAAAQAQAPTISDKDGLQ